MRNWPVDKDPDDIHPAHIDCCQATVADVWWDLFAFVWYRIGLSMKRNQKKEKRRGKEVQGNRETALSDG